MQTDLLFLIATTVGIGGIIGGVVAPMLQAHPIAQDLFVGFWLVFLVGLWAYHFRAPLLAGVGRMRLGRPTPSSTRRADASAFVPLAQVAQELIDADPRSKMMEHARIGDPSPSEVLNWFGIWIMQRELPIYGRRPPATTFELIAAEDLKSGVVDKGASVLRWQGADHLTFHDLAVKRSDFRACRAGLIAAVKGDDPS